MIRDSMKMHDDERDRRRCTVFVIDGIANRSRVRNATAPRSRSCGSTSSTMNSRIIGTARRKLPPQSNDFGHEPRRPVDGETPVGSRSWRRHRS